MGVKDRPDRRGAPASYPHEAEHVLNQTVDIARSLLRRYDTYYEFGYSRARYGTGGRATGTRGDSVGNVLVATKDIRERLMEISDRISRSLGELVRADKVMDQIEELLDKGHEIDPEVDERHRGLFLEKRELLALKQKQVNELKKEIDNAERKAQARRKP